MAYAHIRFYLIRPDAKNTTLTTSELNSYTDSCTSKNLNEIKYLYVNAESISETEEKKVKITRFANRGNVVIDLREQFNSIILKDIYLGRLFGNTTENKEVVFKKKVWKYALNEWNKTGDGKTALRIVNLSSTAENYITEVTATTPYAYSYKSGSSIETTYVWSKAFSIDTDSQGQTFIKVISLEEKL